ncbi:hypothetical protein OESDEN_07890 [Oesophagostomum dentatum]|uniref:Uncharacterized protein n=1 Tax=Oesophagostomum dentatum TaxID=61180 RepID=A0A0B1T4S9_OESDE|nr:hypothetical protein OESDEN_07890 [Oesophagostomum dentatum]
MASFHSFGDLHAPMVMLFAVFGIFSSVISKAVRVEMIYTTIIDFIGFVPTWEAKTFAMFLICLVLGFLSLISYCPDCYMVELSLETIVLPNITLIIMLGELLVICGLYGTERFFNNVSTMIVGKAATFQIQMSAIDKFISFVAMLLWKAVIPVAILFAVIAYLYSPATNVENYDIIAHIVLLLPIPICALYKFAVITYLYSPTTNVENYDIIAHIVLLLPIPICALYKAVYFYLHKMNLWRLFAPDSELWGPRASAHRALAERNEKLL